MEDLYEVARLILVQVDHNRECGKCDGNTMNEIVSIIERRVIRKDTKYSRVEFEGWTNRFVVQMIVDNTGRPEIFITIYTNSNSWAELEEYLRERISSKVLKFNLDYRATREEDIVTGKLLDEVLGKL